MLSARQGKALNEKISALNEGFANINGKVKLGDGGYIDLRDDGYIDIFSSNGNGIIMQLSSYGISAWIQKDGVQSLLFMTH